MTGSGPLGRKPAGRFNFELPAPGGALYLEPSPKRVRVVAAGEVVADSRRVMLLHESGHQPIYYFPPEDVRSEFLVDSERHTRCPKKGVASYYTIRTSAGEVADAAWYYPDPIASAPEIKDLVAFYWNRMEHWYEEDEEVFVHPRDPYHRVDIIGTDRHVRVSLDGEELASSRRAVALFESNLPARWYLPREDVSAELLDSDTITRCPYKGTASYHSVRRADGEVANDVVWCYREPIQEAAAIAGLVCFFNERVDLDLDGELQERPETPWSNSVRSEAPNAPVAETRG